MVGVVQAADEVLRFIVERNNQRLHMAFDHTELVSDGLEWEIEALPCIVVHFQNFFIVQFTAF